MSKRRATSLLLVSAVLFAAGCSTDSSDKPAENPQTGSGDYKDFCDLPKQCQEISQACHPKDIGLKGDPIHECHITGHTIGTLEACSKDYVHCLSVCNAAPALGDGMVEDLSAPCRDR